MAWIKKRGKVWYAFYYDPAAQESRKKSLNTSDVREAKRLLAVLTKELKLLEQGIPLERTKPSPLKIHEALDRYAEYRSKTGHSRHGIQYVRAHALLLKRYLPDVEADQLQSSHLLKYCEGRKGERLRYKTKDVRNQTLNKEMGTLLAALRWGLKEEEVKRPEDRRINRVAIQWKNLPPEAHARNLPEDFGQMQMDMAALEAHLRKMENWPLLNAVMLARHLCFRVASIRSVANWNGVDLKEGKIKFLQPKKKTETWRDVELPKTGPFRAYMEEAWKRDPRHFPVTTHDKWLYKAQVKALGSSASRPRYNFTSLRHLFVYEAKMKGLTPWQVTAILGHSDSNLVKNVYGRFSDIEAGKALSALHDE